MLNNSTTPKNSAPKTTGPKSTTNRQTIWLSTMMVLSLMLIGYYTVGAPGNGGLTPTSQSAKDSKGTATTAKSTQSAAATPAQRGNVNEYFAAQASAATAKMLEQQQKLTAITTDQNAKPEEQQAATQQLQTLQTLMTKQQELEDQIIALGYNDAIVTGDADKVDVVVQADTLDNATALKIMSLVTKAIPNISMHNITIGFHK